jgi:hypothetical protein
MDFQAICPQCKGNISSSDFFCGNCGKKLKEPPLSTTLLKQILIYALSLFLPPAGVWPAVKYLRQPDEKSKRVGIIVLLLTIISIVLTIRLSKSFLNSFTQKLNTQYNFLEEIDY